MTWSSYNRYKYYVRIHVGVKELLVVRAISLVMSNLMVHTTEPPAFKVEVLQLSHPLDELDSDLLGVGYLCDFLLALELMAVDRRYPSSGQKGLICSCKYHCCSMLKPCGGMTLGSVFGSGFHGSFSSLISTSGVSLCSFTNTDLGEEDDTRKW